VATDRILVQNRITRQPIPLVPDAEPILDSTTASWVGLKLQHYLVDGSARPEVTTNSYLAAVCLSGSCETEYLGGSGSKRFKVAWKPGDVFLTGPGDLPARSSKGNVEFLVLEVAPKYLVWAADELAVSPPFEVRPLWYGIDEQLRHLMLTLHHELQTQCLSGRLFGEYLGLSFATVLLTRHCAARSPVGSDPGGLSVYKLRQAVAYIEDNLTSDLSLADLSNLAQMTPCGFSRAFKVSTGVSPHQYILRRRIERALHKLKQAHVSLSDLAYDLGFCSQGHFTSVFRRLVGVSPGNYREQLLSLKDLEVVPVPKSKADSVSLRPTSVCS